MFAGDLTAVASADLGGLGAKEGPPARLNWTLANLMPRLLPWLVVLALLALPSNRTAQAWLIWVPLVAVAALEAGVRTAFETHNVEELNYCVEAACAGTLGLAAVWLSGSPLARRGRFIGTTGAALAIAAVGMLAFANSPLWDELGGEGPWTPQGVLYSSLFWIVCGLALAGGLRLTGRTCRHHFSGVRVLLWLPLWLCVIWAVMVLGAGAVMRLAAGQPTPWLTLLAGVVIFALIGLAMFLPFLILSLTNSFYRQRLRQLLRLPSEDTAAPAPVPATATQTSQLG